ncbi:hypothetical protein SAMN06265365_13021 [Tistlia consotensis]|uniref:PPC domain-containing protein n=1 Tax=Tistlia consotensis USBA 355 TaxID=560819 RepID=A0A1Y6CKB0_9PROT|nr:PPC domain-containing DNA-binding protein [Tistlia consotensis]SMF72446.1 hypothetical protein SAMN05428998_13121 [Tistlia consotensis USBA 355]SNS09152.1 hypothetical protein SAMN06265365_13021 [Tistlia consotensis]
MKIRQLNGGPERSFAVVLDSGEEAVSSLLSFARDHQVEAGRLTALGAFRQVTLGWFDLARKDYRRIRIDEQVELLSMVGDFATAEGEIRFHGHVVVGKSDGTAHGGHLLEAAVRPTLEVMVVDSPDHLRREPDRQTGLALLSV